MTTELRKQIIQLAVDAGYRDADIYSGIAYADRNGYDNGDEAFSIVIAHILYGPSECDGGTRFPVQAGTIR